MSLFKKIIPFIYTIIFLNILISAEPIVINGAMVPEVVGKSIHSLRVINSSGMEIPFQIDEKTQDDEYICSEGEDENSDLSNGKFDLNDEIVFLWDDCSENPIHADKDICTVKVTKNGSIRSVIIISDSTRNFSTKKYIEYDHLTRLLKTPWYYAQFAKDRFHFERAGVTSYDSRHYFDLTSELSIEINLKVLFGLIPIHYTEENLICFVKRWKIGPIRLIRRGDFHLNMGFGVKGSKAAVNQICYPQLVKVPVLLHVPVRFGTLFKDANIKMAPVINKDAHAFEYSINGSTVLWNLKDSTPPIDTIFPIIPCNTLMTLNDGYKGYGWILQTSIPEKSLIGSGILFRNPSKRNGRADCGYHLAIDEVERGYYNIINWVIFPNVSKKPFSIDYRFLITPSEITTSAGTFNNLVSQLKPPEKKRKKR